MSDIDLHTHTTASDGTFSPTELIDYAVSKGLSSIAITDHDTIAGIDEAIERASYYEKQGINIEVIPGIEFSTSMYNKDIHIVGLFIDYKGDYFQGRLNHFAASRTRRNVEMCRRLTEHGMPITYEELVAEFPLSSISRANVAALLLKKGYVKSIKEAFERFIGDHAPCYVPRKKLSPYRAIEIIRKAGGYPIFAHPMLTALSQSTMETLISTMTAFGLRGIEGVYSTYSQSDERQVRTWAAKYNLCISGGSDFHGKIKPDIDLGTGRGNLYICKDILNKIKDDYASMRSDVKSFSIKKILFTDLDATLLRSDKTISNYTLKVLSDWVDAGHYVVLCSGRDLNSVNLVAKELGLKEKNLYTIGYNGGHIYDYCNNETLYKIGLPDEDFKCIVKAARDNGLYIHTYSDTHIIAPSNTPELQYYKRVIKTPALYSEDITAAISQPCKCLIIDDDHNKLEKFAKEMAPYAKEHNISMMFSNPKYLEVIPSVSGKGSAVKKLCELLDIPGLMSVAAGDEENDLSMLEAADIAIAMSNGIDKLKRIATTISEDDAENDGLAKTLVGLI